MEDQEIYENRDIVLQYRMTQNRPKTVCRPQGAGEDQPQEIYENYDKGQSGYPGAGMPAQEEYQELNVSGPQMEAAVRNSLSYSSQDVARCSPVNQEQSNVNLEVAAQKSFTKDDYYDDVVQRQKLQAGNARKRKQKQAENIEMRDLNDSSPPAKAIEQDAAKIQIGRGSFVVSILALIIAVVAVVLIVLLVFGVIAKKCNCDEEIQKLNVRIQRLESRLHSTYLPPVTTSALTTSPLTTPKISPSPMTSSRPASLLPVSKEALNRSSTIMP